MFKPITNPYIVGNPIKTEKMFYGREDDFDYIRRKLESGGRSYIIVLSGERRSGKTSILFQILNGRLGSKFIPILIDMQTMAGLKNESEFFEKFASETIKNLDDTLRQKRYDFHSKDASPYKVFNQLLDDIHAVYPGQNKLFLIDEYELIETKSAEGSLSKNFIPFLAGVLESDRHISFIFTGSKTLQERGTSFWQNLFGKSLFRNVSFLSRQDTFRLITEPVRGQISYDEEVLNAIYRLTSGQPFYTQIVCQNIVDFVNEHERTRITVADLDEIVNEILENPLPQMIYFWNSLPQSQMLMLSLMAEILDGPETEIKPSEIIKATKKKKLGIELDIQVVNSILESLFHIKYVSKTGNGYSFQIDLMRQWIKRDHSIWRVIKDVDIASIMQSERPTSAIPDTDSRIQTADSSGFRKWLIPVGAVILIGIAVGWFALSDRSVSQEPQTTSVAEKEIPAQKKSPAAKKENPPAEEEVQAGSPPVSVEQKPVARQSTEKTTPVKDTNESPSGPADNPGPGAELLSFKREMLAAKTSAQAGQAADFAGELFSRALDAEQVADAAMDLREYGSAGEKYILATQLFNQAAAEASTALETAKTGAAALRDRALAAKSGLGSGYRDLKEYKEAGSLMTQAEIYMQEHKFQLAQKDYGDAVRLYNSALTKRDAQIKTIRNAIAGYVRAIEQKDIDQAAMIAPNYRAEIRDQWAPFFEVAEDIKIDLNISDIRIEGNIASAAAEVIMNFSGAGGTGQKNNWKFQLSENNSQWLINKISEAK